MRLPLINARIREHQVEVSINIHNGLFVQANEVRLEQVFVNLFNNALDAMKQTAHPKLSIDQEISEKFVTTIVSDNGSGIDTENLGNIFDPFFTTKEVGMGLGLGLSISHAIIKKFGGELYAFNNQDNGASFSLRLLRIKK